MNKDLKLKFDVLTVKGIATPKINYDKLSGIYRHNSYLERYKLLYDPPKPLHVEVAQKLEDAAKRAGIETEGRSPYEISVSMETKNV